MFTSNFFSWVIGALESSYRAVQEVLCASWWDRFLALRQEYNGVHDEFDDVQLINQVAVTLEGKTQQPRPTTRAEAAAALGLGGRPTSLPIPNSIALPPYN